MNEAQINFLKQIAVGDISGIIYRKYGLCYHLTRLAENHEQNGLVFIRNNCSYWEHFYGNTTFPIPSQIGYWGVQNKYEGEQLELRSSLARHLLSKLGENL